MTDRSAPPLSPEGARRRETMLRDLKAEIPRLHRRRRRRRAIGGAALLIAAFAATAIIGRPGRPVNPAPAPVAAVPRLVKPALPATREVPEMPRRTLVFDYVAAKPGIVERHTARGTGQIVIVDDEALVTELAAIDRPTGLVRRGDRVWLTADVIDDLRPRVQ